jgi:hypothetical protein
MPLSSTSIGTLYILGLSRIISRCNTASCKKRRETWKEQRVVSWYTAKPEDKEDMASSIEVNSKKGRRCKPTMCSNCNTFREKNKVFSDKEGTRAEKSLYSHQPLRALSSQ